MHGRHVAAGRAISPEAKKRRRSCRQLVGCSASRRVAVLSPEQPSFRSAAGQPVKVRADDGDQAVGEEDRALAAVLGRPDLDGLVVRPLHPSSGSRSMRSSSARCLPTPSGASMPSSWDHAPEPTTIRPSSRPDEEKLLPTATGHAVSRFSIRYQGGACGAAPGTGPTPAQAVHGACGLRPVPVRRALANPGAAPRTSARHDGDEAEVGCLGRRRLPAAHSCRGALVGLQS